MRQLLAWMFVPCVSIAFIAGVAAGANPTTSRVTNLLRAELDQAFAPGREVLVDIVEIPPDSSLDRHWHAGEEFHYYLEGEPLIQIEGRDDLHPQPGTVGHVPYEAVHRAAAGAAGARILVFRVHTKGAPWRYLEDESRAEHDAVRQ